MRTWYEDVEVNQGDIIYNRNSCAFGCHFEGFQNRSLIQVSENKTQIGSFTETFYDQSHIGVTHFLVFRDEELHTDDRICTIYVHTYWYQCTHTGWNSWTHQPRGPPTVIREAYTTLIATMGLSPWSDCHIAASRFCHTWEFEEPGYKFQRRIQYVNLD